MSNVKVKVQAKAKKGDWALQEVTRSISMMCGPTNSSYVYRLAKIEGVDRAGRIAKLRADPVTSRIEPFGFPGRAWVVRAATVQPDISLLHGVEWDTIEEARETLRPHRLPVNPK